MSARVKRPVALIGGGARALPEYLSEAIKVCLGLGVVPVMTEPPPADDIGAVKKVFDLLSEVDVYIGIRGDGPDSTVAEMEYDNARRRGVPELVFVVNADATAGSDPFRGRAAGAGVARTVASPEEFHGLLSYSLTYHLTELGRPGEEETGARKKGVGDIAETGAELETPAGGKARQTFRVFVASPSDVQEERALMPKVVESLNRTLGRLLDVRVELWRWEADTPPAAGPPQPPIDAELDEADVVLAVFWNRFGTPTASGATGTEGEVLRALDLWRRARRPQVMLYFCQRPSLLGREALGQRLKLLEFRERVAPLALAADYEGVREFEWRVRDDLFLTIARLCVKAA